MSVLEIKPCVDWDAVTAPDVTDPIGEALERAADLIEADGHRKYDLGGPGRGFCVLGACNYAHHKSVAGDGGDSWKVIARVARYLGFSHCGGAVDWNNAEERTEQDVIRALREAAAAEVPA